MKERQGKGRRDREKEGGTENRNEGRRTGMRDGEPE